MTITYELNTNLIARAAAQLVWALKQINTPIYIATERAVNAKSLVGLLSGHFCAGEAVKISFDDVQCENQIKEVFNEFGKEVN